MSAAPPAAVGGGPYERRIRVASETATAVIGVILLASAGLPNTEAAERVGLLVAASLLLGFTVVWFHLLPPQVFGRLRFTIGTALTQVIAAALLVLTGGIDSRYFPFFLLPVLAAAFAMRVDATIVTGIVALIAYVAVVADDLAHHSSASILSLALVRFLALGSVIAITALITRTMQDTRAMLRSRSAELAAQNQELATARSIAATLAQLRERDDIVRAMYDTGHQAVGCERVFVFISNESGDVTIGYTVSADRRIESFAADSRLTESPRLRAFRERRTIVVTDSNREAGVTERTRSQFGFVSGIVVPLIQRGEVVGVTAFTVSHPKSWTPIEVRLAETIAEGSAAAVATYLALAQIRETKDELARRMRVVEGLNTLTDALAIASGETAVAETAARSLTQSFELRGATALLTDASDSLLESAGTAGDATPHPVVSGPQNCPAIRSGRPLVVTSPLDPVVCPYMPVREGTPGYRCLPLNAAGHTVGAVFLEPGGTPVEDAFARAAADRVALSIANRRVLDTAQRQAITDGLTGLYNRHFFEEQLRLLQSLAQRHGQGYSVVALDLDGLKAVNDTFGHEMGDLVLRGFANVLRKNMRGSDVGVRTGGDEFIVLMPQAALADASAGAERIRSAVATQGLADPRTAISVSAGVATWRAGRSAEQVVQAADSMLYEAKRRGRDRVFTEAPTASS